MNDDRDALTGSGAAGDWRERFERLWREAGNPPRPVVSRMGSPADVAAREWAAYVAAQD